MRLDIAILNGALAFLFIIVVVGPATVVVLTALLWRRLRLEHPHVWRQLGSPSGIGYHDFIQASRTNQWIRKEAATFEDDRVRRLARAQRLCRAIVIVAVTLVILGIIFLHRPGD